MKFGTGVDVFEIVTCAEFDLENLMIYLVIYLVQPHWQVSNQ